MRISFLSCWHKRKQLLASIDSARSQSAEVRSFLQSQAAPPVASADGGAGSASVVVHGVLLPAACLRLPKSAAAVARSDSADRRPTASQRSFTVFSENHWLSGVAAAPKRTHFVATYQSAGVFCRFSESTWTGRDQPFDTLICTWLFSWDGVLSF